MLWAKAKCFYAQTMSTSLLEFTLELKPALNYTVVPSTAVQFRQFNRQQTKIMHELIETIIVIISGTHVITVPKAIASCSIVRPAATVTGQRQTRLSVSSLKRTSKKTSMDGIHSRVASLHLENTNNTAYQRRKNTERNQSTTTTDKTTK